METTGAKPLRKSPFDAIGMVREIEAKTPKNKRKLKAPTPSTTSTPETPMEKKKDGTPAKRKPATAGSKDGQNSRPRKSGGKPYRYQIGGGMPGKSNACGLKPRNINIPAATPDEDIVQVEDESFGHQVTYKKRKF